MVGLLQGQSNKFGGIVSDKQDSASCSIAQTEFKSKVKCEDGTKTGGPSWSEFDAPKGCSQPDICTG